MANVKVLLVSEDGSALVGASVQIRKLICLKADTTVDTQTTAADGTATLSLGTLPTAGSAQPMLRLFLVTSESSALPLATIPAVSTGDQDLGTLVVRTAASFFTQGGVAFYGVPLHLFSAIVLSPTLTVTPNLSGYTEAMARRKLNAAGLGAEIVFKVLLTDTDATTGRVIAQSVEAGAPRPRNSLVRLTIGRAPRG